MRPGFAILRIAALVEISSLRPGKTDQAKTGLGGPVLSIGSARAESMARGSILLKRREGRNVNHPFAKVVLGIMAMAASCCSTVTWAQAAPQEGAAQESPYKDQGEIDIAGAVQ